LGSKKTSFNDTGMTGVPWTTTIYSSCLPFCNYLLLLSPNIYAQVIHNELLFKKANEYR